MKKPNNYTNKHHTLSIPTKTNEYYTRLTEIVPHGRLTRKKYKKTNLH